MKGSEKDISLKQDYSKEYLRDYKILEGQGRIQEVIEAFQLGLEKDKINR